MKPIFRELGARAPMRWVGRRPTRVRCYTWSSSWLRWVIECRTELKRAGRVGRATVAGCEPYATTYSLRRKRLSHPVRRGAREFAETLLRHDPGEELHCFAGMLAAPMDTRLLHVGFAALRDALVEVSGSPSGSLYSPVPASTIDRGFPLHSDLYLGDRIWLIYDQVAADGSGESTFLPAKRLLRLIEANPRVPTLVRERIHELVVEAHARDSFNRLYGLLHSPSNPWHRSLTIALERAQVRRAFERGEGYLIRDRKWLHGRLRSKSRVTHRRFRRLVFGRAS